MTTAKLDKNWVKEIPFQYKHDSYLPKPMSFGLRRTSSLFKKFDQMKLIKNKYKCPLSLWKKLSEEARKVYNDVMEASLRNQNIMTHPKMEKMPKAQWDTICHNFACYAAWDADKKL